VQLLHTTIEKQTKKTHEKEKQSTNLRAQKKQEKKTGKICDADVCILRTITIP
jgi:hypothetical protein